MQPISQRKVLKRACDACRLRKVKCSGAVDGGDGKCQQCMQLDLECVYTAKQLSMQKKAGKRSNIKRGRVISLYKQATTPSTILDPKTTSITAEAIFLAKNDPQAIDSQFDCKYFLNLMPQYMESVYPASPIIGEDEMVQIINEIASDSVSRALVYAMGAATIGLSIGSTDSLPGVMEQAKFLCTRALDVRGPFRPHETITLKYIMISHFLHMCFASQQDHVGAWFYVRETATLAQLLRINEDVDGPTEPQLKQLYWVVYICERNRAIFDYRYPILRFPKWDFPMEQVSTDVYNYWFINLKQLLTIDDVFINNWLTRDDNALVLTKEWIENKHQELSQLPECITEEEQSSLTEMFYFDVALTRWWIRMLLWKIATAGGYLDSNISSGCIYVGYPMQLARKLCSLIESTTLRLIEMNCGCVVRKMYEIICPLADLIITLPSDSDEKLQNDIDNCRYLINFLYKNCRMSQTRRHVLDQKMKSLDQVFPSTSPSTSSPQS